MARPENPASIYLDSAALLLAINKQPGFEPVEDVLQLADAGKITLYTSALVYVEVRGQGLGGPFDEAADARVLAILDGPRIITIDFHRTLAIRARRYAHQYSLKNSDAVHVASAVEASADVLMTSDKGFKLGRREIDGVWIDEPYTPGDPRLFLGNGQAD